MNNSLKKIEKDIFNNDLYLMDNKIIDFINKKIKKLNFLNILEINSEYGYGAISIAKNNPFVLITAIEKDNDKFSNLIDNVDENNLKNNILGINCCVIEDKISLEKYELIIINQINDSIIEQFLNVKDNIKNDGLIIFNNIDFSNDKFKEDNKFIKAIINGEKEVEIFELKKTTLIIPNNIIRKSIV